MGLSEGQKEGINIRGGEKVKKENTATCVYLYTEDTVCMYK